jgi:hypothetical protein
MSKNSWLNWNNSDIDNNGIEEKVDSSIVDCSTSTKDKVDTIHVSKFPNKENYRLIDEIDTGIEIDYMQCLPWDEIIYGNLRDRHDYSKLAKIVKNNTVWKIENLSENRFMRWIHGLQVLPDGRIITASNWKINIWTKKNDIWESIKLKQEGRDTGSIKILPEGGFISANQKGLNIWKEDMNGDWIKNTLKYDITFFNNVNFLEVISDNKFLVITGSKSVKYYNKIKDSEWKIEIVYSSNFKSIYNLLQLSEDNIIIDLKDDWISILNKENGKWIWNKLFDSLHVTELQLLDKNRFIWLERKKIDIDSFDYESLNKKKIVLFEYKNNKWNKSFIDKEFNTFTSLKVLPDGRIVWSTKEWIIKIYDGDIVE